MALVGIKYLKKSKLKNYLKTILIISLSFSIFFLLGNICLYLKYKNIIKHSIQLKPYVDTKTPSILEGIILLCPKPLKNNGIRYKVVATKILSPYPKKLTAQFISLTLKDTPLSLIAPGDVIRFKAKLKSIRNYNSPGSFNRKLWWEQKDIRISAYCNSPLNIAIISKWEPNHFDILKPWLWPIFLERLRFKILNELKTGFSDSSFPLAAALLLGIKTAIPDTTRQLFSDLGIGHLLAISGLHMALIGLLFGSTIYIIILFIPNALYYLNIRKFTCAITLIFLFIYCALTGFSPSATRAFIMILTFSIAFLFDLSSDSLNTLAIAAWIILLLNPLSLFSISFQLSFSAVLFLILSWKVFSKKELLRLQVRDKKYRLFKLLYEFLLISLIAFVVTVPLISFYFNRISIISIIANLFFVPIISFLILPLLISSLFLLLIYKDLAFFLWKIANYAIEITLNAMNYLSKLVPCALWVSPPTILEIVIYYGILTLIFLIWMYDIKWKKSLSLLAIGLCLFILFIPKINSFNGIRFYVLDVGQGLCQVLELPRQKKIVLIDAGPSFPSGFNTGQVVVGPFLRKIGYKKIDIVICSHPERDHIGGIIPLINEFKIGKIFYPYAIKTNNICWKQTLTLIGQKHIKTFAIHKIKTIKIDNATIKIFPYINNKLSKKVSKNERCLVTEVIYKQKKILLCADINKRRELSLIKTQNIRKIDVIVVPHHGSLSSSSLQFLKATKPHIAIFSVGFNNHLHLPSNKVVNRYKGIGALILRTDINGTICIAISDKAKLYINCYKNY